MLACLQFIKRSWQGFGNCQCFLLPIVQQRGSLICLAALTHPPKRKKKQKKESAREPLQPYATIADHFLETRCWWWWGSDINHLWLHASMRLCTNSLWDLHSPCRICAEICFNMLQIRPKLVCWIKTKAANLLARYLPASFPPLRRLKHCSATHTSWLITEQWATAMEDGEGRRGQKKRKFRG